MKADSIKVFIRIRPLLYHEEGQEQIIKADSDVLNILVNHIQGKHVNIEQTSYTMKQRFDTVFEESKQQMDVFQSLKPSLAEIINGINCTIFAYGQTGSGKTYTMFGADWEKISQNSDLALNHQSTHIEGDIQQDMNNAGIIPRSIHEIFQLIDTKNYFVYCSFLQIYNEKIFDLLQDHQVPKPLDIHESRLEGIYVEGLTEYAVNHYYDCLTLMKRGERNRKIRSTSMNVKSSRSHTIFQILIESSKADKQGALKKCKVNLCDLAGSEKINKNESMQVGHLQELKTINQSLSILGKVIHNLSQNFKHKTNLPIPYRESKLTRLLQDSLGGNTQTNIIVNVASGMYDNICILFSDSILMKHIALLNLLKELNLQFNSLNICQINVIIKPNKIDAMDQELVRKLSREIDYLKGILNMKRRGLNANDMHFKLMKLQEENDILKINTVSVKEVENLIQENRYLKLEIQKMHQSQSMTNDGLSEGLSPQTNSPKIIDYSLSNSFLKSEGLNSMRKLKNSKFKFTDEPMYNSDRPINPINPINRRIKSELSENGLFVVSNSPVNFPKTQVTVRIRGKGNSLQTRKGYVEQSDQQFRKEKHLKDERIRVLERLMLLDRIQQQQSYVKTLPDIQSESIVQCNNQSSPNVYKTKKSSSYNQQNMKQIFQNQKVKQAKRIEEYDQKLKIIEKQLISI